MGRQRRASESDTMLDRIDLSMIMSEKQQRDVDILQMLSKAQDEYDNVRRLQLCMACLITQYMSSIWY